MMTTNNYTTSILVDQSPEAVFNAICNPRAWWQGEIEGITDQLNGEFTYEMQPYHFSKQKIVTFIPNEKVVWLVTESQINFVEDKEEWLNTEIIFDIKTEGKITKLSFTHEGLKPTIECYDACSGAWKNLIEKSLFSFIKTGKGVPVF